MEWCLPEIGMVFFATRNLRMSTKKWATPQGCNAVQTKADFSRKDAPFISRMWERKVCRSTRAAAIVVFSNSSVQREKGRFVVTMGSTPLTSKRDHLIARTHLRLGLFGRVALLAWAMSIWLPPPGFLFRTSRRRPLWLPPLSVPITSLPELYRIISGSSMFRQRFALFWLTHRLAFTNGFPALLRKRGNKNGPRIETRSS